MGLVFAGVAAITNQLTVSARSATAIAMAILGISYLVRAVGDVLGGAVNPSWLSWMSPIGWGQQVRPYAGDRFVVLFIPVVALVLLVCIAFRLQSMRDLGGGFIPERTGSATAARTLASPLGLAWRLQFPMLAGWFIAYVVLSAVIGSIVNDLSGMLDTPEAQQLITSLGGGDNVMKSFVSMEFGIIAFVTAAYGIVTVRRLTAEESSGHAEVLLATQISRKSYVLSHLWIGLVGTFLLTLTQGCVFALAGAVQSGDYSQIGLTITAALVTLPAIWVMIAIVIAAYGVNSAFTFTGWVFLIGFLLIAELGALLSWPQWLMNSSPFAQIPHLPAVQMNWVPVMSLTVVAVFLIAFGLIRMQRRDVQG
jgi:ABC-2 type transport system permease protein